MRRTHPLFPLVLLALAAAAFASPARALDRQLEIAPVQPAAERRVALVVGNGAYRHAPLRNPVNDARAISKALAASGFRVTMLEDASQGAMRRAIRDFGDALAQGGVGLFYYAGHGIQVRGRNYLLPVNADIQREDEIEDQAIDANLVLAKMDSAKNALNLVILDACRNNPFARSFRSAAQGLAQMDAPSGTLIAFATAPGSVAADGDGDHGLYTKHLLANMTRPGLPIEQVFKEVRIGVGRETADRQVPWESSSLKGNFYFRPPAGAPAGAPASAAAERERELDEQARRMAEMVREMLAKQSADRELAFWETIKNSANPEDFKAYLAQWPKGTFAPLARTRLGAAAEAAAPPKPAAQLAAIAPSAAAGADPRLPRVGDRWEYRYTDVTTRRQRTVKVEVQAISNEGIVDSDTLAGRADSRVHGAAVDLEVIHPIWQFSPYLLSFSEAERGKRWTGFAARGDAFCSRAPSCLFSATVVGREKVKTPAGEFEAVKVEVDLISSTHPGGGPGFGLALRRIATYWYAGAAKRIVKASLRTPTGYSLEPDYDLELVSFRLN